ncbi:CHAT domain-containing protein [Actinokineospora iranica]|uniref:Tetratricopeptide repeat-containing protein n=1 Tax=Actinokineospora iranica TaxID=1271860 RepID=A0A1G6M8M9_9PSEU|nr:CHAT domain-containing tetratricopeptide repeat protein [Actinokineospora iranica]SDC51849.1 Tetratricopeptide repeat-containing protein [Actinokineospora iranica]
MRALHRRAIEVVNSGQPKAGASLLRRALAESGWPERTSPLTARLLGTLAAAEVALGNTGEALRLLDHADDVAAPEDRALMLSQRALVSVLVGRMDDALAHFDDAIAVLRRGEDRAALARVLLNRGMLHQIAGRVRLALADLDQCARIGGSLGAVDGMPRTVAKAVHGRGQCRVLTGDIPAALRDFDIAAAVYADQGEGMLVVLAADRARALLAAGLPSEAATELDAALRRFPRLRMTQEHAEAELTMARANLAAGYHADARRWAARARRRFRRRGNHTWAAVAELTMLRADFDGGRRTAGIARGAARLAERLRTLGLRIDAEAAALLAARTTIALGDLTEARALLAGRDRPGAPLEVRLLRRIALAELGAAAGDRATTFAHARRGLALLRDHRGRFGSLDLQTGTTSLGGELASAGLAAALDSGSPEVVYRWLERTRAQAFRFRPVRTPADEQTVDAVAELRHHARQARAAELAGSHDPVAQRRCTQLEREIRARGWRVDGTGELTTEASFGELTAELAASDSVLVSYLTDGSRLLAQVVGDGRAALLRLGDPAAVHEAIARLRSDLDAACGRWLPTGLRQAIDLSIRHQVATLTEHLLDPLLDLVGDHNLVLAPTRGLSAVPWNLLDPLRGRPVTVTPSPSTWVTAHRAPRPSGPVLLVGGPNLDHATDEVDRLAEIYPDATVLDGPYATVEATLKDIDHRGLAHFACHGHHEQENVLFSRLDLVDGPLMAYDVHQLAAVPEHVVLSSCDTGRAVVRAGDEILGFTAALLYSGSRTVVSAVARVDDTAVVEVMTAYHRAIARGVPPGRAIAEATQTDTPMPFVCFGSGD